VLYVLLEDYSFCLLSPYFSRIMYCLLSAINLLL